MPMITAVFNLTLLVGCAAVPQLSCPASEERSVNEMLYFGTAKPDGVVTPNDWEDFLRTSITPRFPNGFTVWQASGQWQNLDKTIIKETSFVVSIVHPDDDSSEKSVRTIVNEYKRRFEQESVLRMKSPVCLGKGTLFP
jgi:Protein of unknown function (DUF3574)